MIARIERNWPGETVFILASGPSLLKLDLSRLTGRRVIAVKSSWVHYPSADVLFFADGRWWRQAQLRPAEFAGEIYTSAAGVGDKRVKQLNRIQAERLSPDPNTVAGARTSTTGAINIAVHKGAAKIVLLGVDAKRAPDGRRHSHGMKWPWLPGGEPKAFNDQIAEFRRIAPSAKQMGVSIVNANPDSAVDAFPKVRFEETVAEFA